VPGAARDAAGAGARANPAPSAKFTAQDIEFCAELQRHGGVAVAETGFRAEAELLRMRQAGLLELRRDQAPPFAVTRVALTQTARDLVSRSGGTPIRQPAGVPQGSSQSAMTGGLDRKRQQMLRRNGFEVARAMCGAAVKSEIAAWMAAGEPGGCAALETRILTRITEIEVPFPA
jgi:hypothetical protein